MTTALQVLGVNLPTDVIQMLPFITVMLVLVMPPATDAYMALKAALAA